MSLPQVILIATLCGVSGLLVGAVAAGRAGFLALRVAARAMARERLDPHREPEIRLAA